MLTIQKSKSVIGFFALIFLVFLSPSALAGKPGSVPNLSGAMCKSFGGIWKAGKFGICTLNSAANINRSFNLGAGDILSITAAATATITDGTRITNNGSISNAGAITDCVSGSGTLTDVTAC